VSEWMWLRSAEDLTSSGRNRAAADPWPGNNEGRSPRTRSPGGLSKPRADCFVAPPLQIHFGMSTVVGLPDQRPVPWGRIGDEIDRVAV
jgi:hypothetical protein